MGLAYQAIYKKISEIAQEQYGIGLEFTTSRPAIGFLEAEIKGKQVPGLDSLTKLELECINIKLDALPVEKRTQLRDQYYLFRKGHLAYLDLLTDKLFMYAVLSGKMPVADDFGNQQVIDSVEKLYLVKDHGTSSSSWSDPSLAKLRARRYGARNEHRNFPTYMSLIDELLSHKTVISRLGVTTTYHESVLSTKKTIKSRKDGAILENPSSGELFYARIFRTARKPRPSY